MAFDYNKLRGRIVEKYGTIGAFATVLGVTIQTVSAKLTNKSSFSQEDVIEWSGLLGIDPTDYCVFFYTLKV